MALLVVLGALLIPTTSAADTSRLADRIAETLCFPPSTREMRLDRGTAATYRGAVRLEGLYRDIQGPENRAWFEKTEAGAVCRTPADTGLTLFFCADVVLSAGKLVKRPARLCR